MTTHYETRQSIARCCANILYGNYTRQESPSYIIHHTLAGISFLSTPDCIDLARLIIERLGLLLETRYKVCSVIITHPNEDQILITGQIRRR